jgi:hypothetical protein
MTEFATELRHYCRNPKCRSKLPKPVANPREAFCVRGCHSSFYLKRCRICEGAIAQPSGRGAPRLICKKSKCRNTWKTGPELGRWHQVSSSADKCSKNVDSIGPVSPSKPTEPLFGTSSRQASRYQQISIIVRPFQTDQMADGSAANSSASGLATRRCCWRISNPTTGNHAMVHVGDNGEIGAHMSTTSGQPVLYIKYRGLRRSEPESANPTTTSHGVVSYRYNHFQTLIRNMR